MPDVDLAHQTTAISLMKLLHPVNILGGAAVMRTTRIAWSDVRTLPKFQRPLEVLIGEPKNLQAMSEASVPYRYQTV
jgi:hypothetical protein